MSSSHQSPKGEVITRVATIEDSDLLLRLRLEALTTNPEAFAADAGKTSSDGVTAWIDRIYEYEKEQSGAIVIAISGDQIIGMNGIVRGHWPKTRHSGTLWGVYVTPEWRGMYIGEAIVNGCVEWARQEELTVVSLGVIISNIPAIRCYSRCGFTIYGIQPRVTFYNGVYYDDVLMVKLL